MGGENSYLHHLVSGLKLWRKQWGYTLRDPIGFGLVCQPTVGYFISFFIISKQPTVTKFPALTAFEFAFRQSVIHAPQDVFWRYHIVQCWQVWRLCSYVGRGFPPWWKSSESVSAWICQGALAGINKGCQPLLETHVTGCSGPNHNFAAGLADTPSLF